MCDYELYVREQVSGGVLVGVSANDAGELRCRGRNDASDLGRRSLNEADELAAELIQRRQRGKSLHAVLVEHLIAHERADEIVPPLGTATQRLVPREPRYQIDEYRWLQELRGAEQYEIPKPDYRAGAGIFIYDLQGAQ